MPIYRLPVLHSLRSNCLRWGQKQIERQSSLFALVLAPVSWIWGLIAFIKNRLYDLKWLPVFRVGKVVVSVGNITAGGTGKTPFVHLLASHFSHRKVAILSRGYGILPDEPALLARRLPNATVYVGKDRRILAAQAVAEGAELILLDDGFQHRKLHRDFDLVLLDGADPLGKGHYLPWGFLRDSPKRLQQADERFIQGEDFQLAVKRILDQKQQAIETIEGWPVALFCGIAKPDSFKKTIAQLGAIVLAEWILADHQPAGSKELSDFSSRCKALGARALICTEKDFIKIPDQTAVELPILFLEMEMEIKSGQGRWEKLIEKIDEKIDNSCTI